MVDSDPTYPCEQLDSVALHAVDAARLLELLHCNGLRRVETALVYPLLDTVKVHRRHFDLESAFTPSAYSLTALCPQLLQKSSLVLPDRISSPIEHTHGLYLLRPRTGVVISSGVCPPWKPAGTFPWAC